MYFPEFSITNSILKNIGKIEASRALIEHTPIQPTLLNKIEKEAEFKNIYYSNLFEGDSPKYEEAKKYYDGMMPSSDRRFKNLENYDKALHKAYSFSKISEDLIKSLHNELLADIAPKEKTGSYRNIAFLVKGTNNYSPSPDEILASLRSFFSWFDEDDAKDLPVPIRCAILYFEIYRIQPFEVGTKKIAGIITLFDLFIEKYDLYKLVSIEKYFSDNPTTFHDAVRSTQNAEGDITKWVEYFLNGLSDEYEAIKDRVISLSKDSKILKIAGMKPLNDRQEKIVEFLHDYGNIQNKDFERLLPTVSEDSILRDLKDLVSKGVIEKSGSTKSARYIAKPPNSQSD